MMPVSTRRPLCGALGLACATVALVAWTWSSVNLGRRGKRYHQREDLGRKKMSTVNLGRNTKGVREVTLGRLMAPRPRRYTNCRGWGLVGHSGGGRWKIGGPGGRQEGDVMRLPGPTLDYSYS